MQTISLTISAIALITSLVTAWLTLFRRGTVRMTHPSVIYLGPDSGPVVERGPKIYLRTLLFCTAKRGRVIETMYVTIRRNESRTNFSVWVLGDDRLSRGSGLYVGETGVVANHHFLPPRDETPFVFKTGSYHIEVFAKLIDERKSKRLFAQELHIDEQQGKALEDSSTGIYFDWASEAGKYISHAKDHKEDMTSSERVELLKAAYELVKVTQPRVNLVDLEGDRNER